MLLHDVDQGSADWFAARLGIPTASEFSKIFTPTGKPSKQDDDYANMLLAEIITGAPVKAFEGTPWMERGNELEADAVKFYELQTDLVASPGGFVTDDARTMGASPDRMVGEDGLLEIKCPAANTQVDYLLTQHIDQKYYPQVQGQLLITGRQWVDLVAYHPTMPSVIIRVWRDDEYITGLALALEEFKGKLAAKRQQLVKLGYMEGE